MKRADILFIIRIEAITINQSWAKVLAIIAIGGQSGNSGQELQIAGGCL